MPFTLIQKFSKFPFSEHFQNQHTQYRTFNQIYLSKYLCFFLTVVTDFESAGIALTVVYFLSTLPVWIFQHKIQYWDIRSMCTLEWLCPNFVLSNLPIRRSASQMPHQTNLGSRNRNSNGCNRAMQGSGSASSRSGQYLPSYAQCTTNTFLAPSHTHVNHLPASKGMNRVRQSFNPVKSSEIWGLP